MCRVEWLAMMMGAWVAATGTLGRVEPASLPTRAGQARQVTPAGADELTTSEEFRTGAVRMIVRAGVAGPDGKRPFDLRILASDRGIRGVEYMISGHAGQGPVTETPDFRVNGRIAGPLHVTARVRLAPMQPGGSEEVVLVSGPSPKQVGAAAASAAALPDGLRFQLDVLPEIVEERRTNRFAWQLRLVGDPVALRQVRRVSYALPADLFQFTAVEGRRKSGFMIDGDCPDVAWEIRAKVYVGNRLIEQVIPFKK